MIARFAPLASLLLFAAACAKQDPPAPAEPAPAPPPAATTAAPAPAPTAAEADLATEEDFEEEAAKEVTAANLDSQLDALEKEINAE